MKNVNMMIKSKNTRIEAITISSMIDTNVYKTLEKKLTDSPSGWRTEEDKWIYCDDGSGIKITLLRVYQKQYHGQNCLFETGNADNVLRRIKTAIKNSGLKLQLKKLRLKGVTWNSTISFETPKRAASFLLLAAKAKSPVRMEHKQSDEESVVLGNTKGNSKKRIEFTADGKNVCMRLTFGRKRCEKLQEKYDDLSECPENNEDDFSECLKNSEGILSECLENLESEGMEQMKKALTAMLGEGEVHKADYLIAKFGKINCLPKAYESLVRFVETARREGTDAAFEKARELHEENEAKNLTETSIRRYFHRIGCSTAVLPDDAEDPFE